MSVENPQYELGIHIFRRDLRLEDNTSLNYLNKHCKNVLCCFILDKRQLEENPYRSDNALAFMFESLEELHTELEKKGSKLYLFYGISEDVITKIIQTQQPNIISFNQDYTPFAKQRDATIQRLCKELLVECKTFSDVLLQHPDTVTKDNGEPYTIFTPFYKKARQVEVQTPIKSSQEKFFSVTIPFSKPISFLQTIKKQTSPKRFMPGGRKEGLIQLKKSLQLDNYATDRDIPSKNYTSHLSPHLKFGTVSIREVYWELVSAFGKEATIISELYWRDFFTQITHHFPHVFKGAFRKQYDKLSWSTSKENFQKWCEGQTGYPIVDAGMRELNETGYMHNRVRMIVASFLVKDLHLHWQWGEKYFAKQLVDYDPSINNGNWQWAASTGCDAQPYFRIFNPFRQQLRFDHECEYIKKWVPELRELSAKEIHNLEKNRPLTPIEYPQLIVHHKESSEFAKAMFKTIT